MTTEVPPWAAEAARMLPRPLLFATVSGAHLYGFASVDSDLDLRGAHLLPPAEVVGLRTGPQTLQYTGVRDGVELDVVSHDLLKFAKLLNSRNGYVLEQVLSPLVVVTSPVHAELTSLVPRLITRHHAHHYLGFAATQQNLYARTGKLKPALYTLRVLLTGIHLMRTGRLETDLGVLGTGLPYVPDLIAAKRGGRAGTVTRGRCAATRRRRAAASRRVGGGPRHVGAARLRSPGGRGRPARPGGAHPPGDLVRFCERLSMSLQTALLGGQSSPPGPARARCTWSLRAVSKVCPKGVARAGA